MARRTVEDLYVGGNNLVINSTGRTENKDVHTDGDYVGAMMVGNHNVLQIDNGVDLKLRGTGKGSVKMQEIVDGTNHTIEQHGAKKVVESTGATNAEVGIVSIKNSGVEINSENAKECVRLTSSSGTTGYVLKAVDSHIGGKSVNSTQVVIKQ